MNFNRRDFLKLTGAASAALAIPSFTEAAESKGKYIGMQLYTVRNDIAKDVDSTIRYVAQAGYNQIEMYGFDGKTFFGKKSAKEMKALLSANKLTSPSGHYYLPPVMYENNMDLWKQCLEAGHIMGHKYMVIPWVDEQHRNGEYFKKLAETMNTVAELTKKAGMKLAYHNHDFEFKAGEDGKTFYENLLNNTDKNLVEFEMDLYWVIFAGQKPQDWFAKYPGRFTMWHIKDMAIMPNGQKQSTQVGDGSIDFKSIYAKRQLAGLQYGFMEQEAYTMPEEECIKRSIAAMKKDGFYNYYK
jgi:sugar phosphate isomerase/epimerase